MTEAPKVDAALYYPYINVRDPRWLKQAILYWDVLWRIAPWGYESVDPPNYWLSQQQDMAVLENAGIVRRIHPNLGDPLAPMTILWHDFIDKQGEKLAQRYRIDLSKHEQLPEEDVDGRGYGPDPERRRRGLGWLLTDKMDPILLSSMKRLGLAIESSSSYWHGFNERLLGAYMTSMANELISSHSVETITDDPRHFRLFPQNTLDALQATLLAPLGLSDAHKRSNLDDGIIAINLAVESVCPAGIESFSFHEILEIRAKSSTNRKKFKNSLASMVAELRALRGASLDDTLHPEQLADLRKRHLDEPLANLREDMATKRGDAVLSLVTVKSALDAGTLGAGLLALMGAGPAIVGVVGLALAVVPVVRAFAKSKKEITDSPLAWLLDIEAKAGAREAVLSASQAEARLVV